MHASDYKKLKLYLSTISGEHFKLNFSDRQLYYTLVEPDSEKVTKIINMAFFRTKYNFHSIR